MTGAQKNVYLYRGVEYLGAKAVAEAAGIKNYRAVYTHLTKYGHLDNLGTGRAHGPRPATIGTRRWASRADLARFLGRPPATVSKRLNRFNDLDREWFEREIARADSRTIEKMPLDNPTGTA